MISEEIVPVIQEENISNIFLFLIHAAAQGKCIIHTYSENKQYQSMLREELWERIRSWGLDEDIIKKDPRLKILFHK